MHCLTAGECSSGVMEAQVSTLLVPEPWGFTNKDLALLQFILCDFSSSSALCILYSGCV